MLVNNTTMNNGSRLLHKYGPIDIPVNGLQFNYERWVPQYSRNDPEWLKKKDPILKCVYRVNEEPYQFSNPWEILA